MATASDPRPGRKRRKAPAKPRRAEPHGDSARERLVLWQRAAPSTAAEEEAAAWGKAVATRLSVAGGEVIARGAASVCATFDPLEIDDVIDVALGLLADAWREAEGLEVACAVALGELAAVEGAELGLAIDRALLLAGSAMPGELVLDENAHARVEESHLFVRSRQMGPLLGHVLDARAPRKRDCRAALAWLQPALPPDGDANFERLRAQCSQPEPQRIALRSAQRFGALAWVQRLCETLQPKLVLHLGRRGAGLQPLGGLQLALTRADSALSAFLETLADAGVGEPLARLRAGAALSRGEAVGALAALLRADPRPVIVLDRAREIDAPSLAVMTEALATAGSAALTFILADEHGLPPALARLPLSADITVEPLALPDRLRAAEHVLGPGTSADIAARVASLGGGSALGIAEAARTLVCAGDLLFDGQAFRFRTEPRVASQPIPVEALLSERAAGLEANARRLLEALCVAPRAADRSTIERIAALDGLSSEAIAQGLTQLQREGWLHQGPLLPFEHVMRNAVRNGMPPARAAELHRFTAETLMATGGQGAQAGFGRALIAHHLAEGGREREAAPALLDAAQAAAESGFARMAMRLAAVALRLDSTTEISARARALARKVEDAQIQVQAPAPAAPPSALQGGLLPARPPERLPTMSLTPAARDSGADAKETNIANAAARAATRAILRGDSEAAETLIDTAVADGFGRAAAQRLWAIAQLRRGDVPGAVRALRQAQAAARGEPTRIREALTAALILLESREPLDGVRAALDGLARARRAADRTGERAALHVLSGCYRMLGREADAARLEAAAEAGSPPVVEDARV